MHEYKAKLLRIVDGDTVDLAVDAGFDIWFNARFRLYGINAAEIRTKNLEEKARGLAAKDWLADKLKDKEIVIQTYKEDKQEKYGRYLAKIFVDGVNLNDLMVQEGFAKVYP